MTACSFIVGADAKREDQLRKDVAHHCALEENAQPQDLVSAAETVSNHNEKATENDNGVETVQTMNGTKNTQIKMKEVQMNVVQRSKQASFRETAAETQTRLRFQK